MSLKKRNSYLEIIKGFIPELSNLGEIERYMESVEARLDKLYSEHFPKQCTCCGKIYLSRAEYLEETEKLAKKEYSPEGSILSQEKVMEYRNCVCNSTLVVITTCRRDGSDLGQLRRKLFNRCREKLIKEHNLPGDVASYVLRLIFHDFATRVSRIRGEGLPGSLSDKKKSSQQPVPLHLYPTKQVS